jgi:hypothetical protein
LLPSATTRRTDVIKVMTAMQQLFRNDLFACMLEILTNWHQGHGTVDF